MIAAFAVPASIPAGNTTGRITVCTRTPRRLLSAMSTARAISAAPGQRTIEQQPVRTPVDTDSKVLVIGASRGIGLEFVSQCLARGAQVYATTRGASKLSSLNAKHGDRLHIVELDVRGSLEGLSSIPLGSLTHVIHNAGVVGSKFSLEDTTMDEMSEVFSVNACGVLNVAQAVAPSLQPQGRRLPVYGVLSSKVGSVDDNGFGDMYAYRASKAACNIIVKSLSIDLAGRVAFVLLHPGYVRTDMTGGEGYINCDESVAGMLKAVEATGPEVGFRWVDYKAELIPW